MDQNPIIQWNCRSLKARQCDLSVLCQQHHAKVFCLQETLHSPNSPTHLKNYTGYHKFSGNENNHPKGGTSIFIHNTIPQSQIQLNTHIDAIATTITLSKTFTLCNIYLPPTSNPSVTDLENLIRQLPKPFLLVGDFNAHSTLWENRNTDSKGRLIEKIIENFNLCILNTGSPTFIHFGTKSRTIIDLSLCTPDLFLNLNWRVSDDLHGSDHFPIIISENNQNLNATTLPKWKFNKADWEKFAFLCIKNIKTKILSDPEPIILFTCILQTIMDDTIPKTKAKGSNMTKPWFDEECKEAIAKKKKALSKFLKNMSTENVIEYKRQQAIAKKLIKTKKRLSWQSYISKLNSKTPIGKVWQMIRKINGKNNHQPVHHLMDQDEKITDKLEITERLGTAFKTNFSTSNYTESFQSKKLSEEQVNLNFYSNNKENYNQPFTFRELNQAIHNSLNTAAGPDDIHNQVLKMLPEPTQLILLEIFNDMWELDRFPDLWRDALIIPLPKPNKDPTNPNNYRPISLTSCLCKTFERMINNRLVWYLESRQLLSVNQCGFRKHRTTTDQLLKLETHIREALIKGEHIVTIFFDLEKAYDTAWKYGVLRDLKDLGLKGHLPIFIQNFLSDRRFRVRMGASMSDYFTQEEGYPQGSVLSVTLFIIKINGISSCFTKNINNSLFVDDFCISFSGNKMHVIERQLQQAIKDLEKWTHDNGFKFSKTKTVGIHFCHKRKQHQDPVLTLNESVIPIVTETKYLGVIFDRKLSFLPHIKELRAKCDKAISLMRVVSAQNWGADRDIKLKLYRTLIRSKLDYGCIVYGSARPSYLKILDPIPNTCLRISLNAFKSSPQQSLYVEANEPPLQLRRLKLSLQYATKLYTNKDNPTHKIVFQPQLESAFISKPSSILPFGLRIRPHLQAADINIVTLHDIKLPKLPPWTLHVPIVNTELHKSTKSSTLEAEFKTDFELLRERYHDYYPLYTDGSKIENKSGAAVITPLNTTNTRLPDGASIFTAECKALLMALKYIQIKPHEKFIIFVDSLSVLQSLKNMKLENPLILQILEHNHQLFTNNKLIIYCWIPSHVNILGNEKADKAAKAALEKEVTPLLLPYTDMYVNIRQYIKQQWQNEWNNQSDNKLYSVQPLVGSSQPKLALIRDDMVIRRARIGHTKLTHGYLMDKNAQPPMCDSCQQRITVRHILIECSELKPIRDIFFKATSLKTLFEKTTPEQIIEFLKEIELFNKF